MDKRNSFIEKCYKDKEGRVVVTQIPNTALVVFVLSSVVTHITQGTVNQIAELVAFGTIFTWAWLEVFQGVNYLRRALGLAILVLIVVNRV